MGIMGKHSTVLMVQQVKYSAPHKRRKRVYYMILYPRKENGGHEVVQGREPRQGRAESDNTSNRLVGLLVNRIQQKKQRKNLKY
jgi:hypothetical protein